MKTVRVNFIEHSSAKDIVIAYYRFDHPRMKEKTLLKLKTEFELRFGKKTVYPGSIGDVIKVVRSLGMWGFCDKVSVGPRNPEIHYWVGKKAKQDKIKIVELFAHEVGHAIGYSSENMATRFGGVAAFSYMSMMEEVYGEIHNEKTKTDVVGNKRNHRKSSKRNKRKAKD